MGRTRVVIKKIEDKARRQTTFTKRRQGLFKKAGELGARCDAEVAVIAFSLAGNVYAYGHPNFKAVMKRYDDESLNEDIPAPENGEQLTEKSPASAEIGEEVKELEGEYEEAVARAEVEKGVGAILETVVQCDGGDGKAVWEEAIENLGLAELEQLESTMKEMHNKVVDIKIRYTNLR